MPRDNPLKATTGSDLASTLSGDALSRLWLKNYVTKGRQNPAPGIAKIIRALPDDVQAWNAALKDRADIPVFLREVVDIERSAAEKTYDQTRITALAGLAGFLEKVQPQEIPLPIELLPEAQSNFLKMLERETAHNNNPFKNTYHASVSFGKHFAHEVKEHRYAAIPSGMVGLGAAWLLTAKLGTTQAMYIDPGYTTIVDDPRSFTDDLPDFESMDFSDMDSVMEHIPDITVDETRLNLDFQGGCDVHLKNFGFSEDTVKTLMDWHVDKLLGTHCMKADSFLLKGQGYLQAYNERIDWVTSNPALSLTSNFLTPGDKFTETYQQGLKTNSDTIKVVNTIENFTLHTSIPAVSYSACFALVWAAIVKNTRGKKHGHKPPGFLARQWNKTTSPLKNALKSAYEAADTAIIRATYAASVRSGKKLDAYKEKRSIISGYKKQFSEHDDDHDGWSNTAKSVKDFANRTLKNNWGSYLASGGTATSVAINDYFWSATSGLNPDMVWMGAGAALSGNVVHKLHKYFTRAAHSNTVISDAVVQTLSSNLKDFANDAPAIKHKVNILKDVFKPAAVGAVTVGALAALDNQTTGGVYSAHAAAILSTWVPFLGVNVIEDTSWHLGLGALGGVSGGASAAIAGGSYIAGRNIYQALRPSQEIS